jgi:hypothetical protein
MEYTRNNKTTNGEIGGLKDENDRLSLKILASFFFLPQA